MMWGHEKWLFTNGHCVLWWTFKALGGASTWQKKPFWSSKTVLCCHSTLGCLQTAMACWIWPSFTATAHINHCLIYFTCANAFFHRINCTTISLNNIVLRSLQWAALIWWNNEAYGRWCIFWKLPICARPHDDGFPGTNSSDFFRTFTSCWSLLCAS